MCGFIIYLIGFIISYYWARYHFKRIIGTTWKMIGISFLFGVTSWLGVVVQIWANSSKDMFNTPPRWL